VKLYWFSTQPQLYLGNLVHVFGTHVSAQDPTATSQHEGKFLSLFPERDKSVLVAMEEETEDNRHLYRIPLGMQDHAITGISSLTDFIKGKYTEHGSRILVCVMKIDQVKEGKKL
jgi:hypothetical protein